MLQALDRLPVQRLGPSGDPRSDQSGPPIRESGGSEGIRPLRRNALHHMLAFIYVHIFFFIT